MRARDFERIRVARDEQSRGHVYGATLENMEAEPDVPESRELRRFTRREYDEMVDKGFFEDERIELLEGFLVTMSPQSHEHFSTSMLIQNKLVRALPETYGVANHSPFCATDDSEPEPDICVFDLRRFPRTKPTEALLIVEVSGDSLRRDGGVKRRIYAKNGVPEYWIVDLVRGVVEVYREPRRNAYDAHSIIEADGILRPQFAPEIEIPVSGLTMFS